MLEILQFCLVIGAIMTIGYTCGALAFRLTEEYYGKKDD